MKTVVLVGTMVPNSRLSLTVDTVCGFLDTECEKFVAEEIDFGNFDPTLDEQPQTVKDLRLAVEEADQIVIGTPLYNGSISGPTKNMVDAIPRTALDETRVGFVVVSGGQFPRTAAEHLTTMVRSLGGDVINRDFLVPEVTDKVDSKSGSVSEEVEENAKKFAESLENEC